MTNMNNTQKANENRINGNCKGVRCLTDGKFYPAMKFAAKEVGVSSSSMSYAIKHKTPCKGKRYAWESETEENVMEMGRQLSEMETLRANANARANNAEVKLAEMETELAEFRKWKAEQEAKRKAEEARLERERKEEEKRQAKVTKLEDKIERLETLIDRKRNEEQKLVNKRNKALDELKALMDNGKEVL